MFPAAIPSQRLPIQKSFNFPYVKDGPFEILALYKSIVLAQQMEWKARRTEINALYNNDAHRP